MGICVSFGFYALSFICHIFILFYFIFFIMLLLISHIILGHWMRATEAIGAEFLTGFLYLKGRLFPYSKTHLNSNLSL
jgi:hypothetical protein